MRILICDDEAAILRLLSSVLQGAGYEVFEAHDGREALHLLQSQPCDLVLTDIFMDGQEGIETIRALRQRWPGLTIIAMSGGGAHGDTDVLTDALALGADDILPKPFSPADLLRAVRVHRVENVSMLDSTTSNGMT